MKRDEDIIERIGRIIVIRDGFVWKAYENVVFFQIERAIRRFEFAAAFQNQMQRIVIFAHHTFADVGMFAPIRRFEYGEIFIYPRNDKIINVFCGKTFHGLIIPNGEKFVNGVCTKKHSECNKIVKYRNLQI